MALFERLRALRGKARRIRETAYEYAQDNPLFRRGFEQAQDVVNETRSRIEERLETIEGELWDWIRLMQDEARRSHQQLERSQKSATYFEILEVPPGSDFRTVKAAWRRKMRENHPDRFAHDPVAEVEAQRRSQEINRAYRELRVLLTGR